MEPILDVTARASRPSKGEFSFHIVFAVKAEILMNLQLGPSYWIGYSQLPKDEGALLIFAIEKGRTYEKDAMNSDQ